MALVAAAIGGSAAVGGISSLVGSGKSSSASKSAAQESLAATEMSIANEDNLYNRAMAYAQPYIYAGQSALGPMQQIASAAPAGAGFLSQAQQAEQQGLNYQNMAGGYLQQASGMNPLNVLTEQGLQQTPGYQFELQQGLQSTQAAAAARGLGVSGASLKGAATYATGLADANYQTQFNAAQQGWQDVMNQGQFASNLGSQSGNFASGFLGMSQQAQAMQQQNYSQWANIANLGENASAMAGQASTTTAGNISSALSSGSQQYGNYLTQAGQAQAAGTSGVSSALSQGINNYIGYNQYQSNANTLGASGTAGLTGSAANSLFYGPSSSMPSGY